MKIKAACIGTPPSVARALSKTAFASEVLVVVVGEALGVENVLGRPAEYYIQEADIGPAPQEGKMGVEVRLTGVSRGNRTARQFHQALKALVAVVAKTVILALDDGLNCQIFCVVMIDGEVETAPGSGVYSSSLESRAEWVTGARVP